MDYLLTLLIYLGAAVIGVVLFKRLRLGAILGYLVAGVVLGPDVIGIEQSPYQLMHIAEIGVVLLLFVIGLELNPDKLWRMKGVILSLGGGQLLLCAGLIFLPLWLFSHQTLSPLLAVACALALSSTAFAVQLLEERALLNTQDGRKGFAILLMQDLAVIPLLLMVQAMAGRTPVESVPWWYGVVAVVAVLVAGRYLINPVLKAVAHWGSSEIMTALALVIVLGTALAMEHAGLSMGLGAFTAGILLANSSFRHQLATDIEPFKGLLLGLFFLAIGMNLDIARLLQQPLLFIGLALALMVIKTGVIALLLKLAKARTDNALRIALMLSQGGEFAFVLMTQSENLGVVSADLASAVTLVVSLSMAFTSPLLMLLEALQRQRQRQQPQQAYDSESPETEPQVIIAGFGRFGQITGRILSANHIRFTALDKSIDHISFVKKFGHKVFFGDAARLDLLRTAGIEHAKVLLIAINDEQATKRIIQVVAENFPSLIVIARVHNRFAYINLHNNQVTELIRELYGSSLSAAESVLRHLGLSESEASHKVSLFRKHDEQMMQQMQTHQGNLEKIIETGLRSRAELEQLFDNDRQEKTSS
ncbi:monovalent cation:proton antiporter-2 (CPA2) family protein [Idiomarina xiamenensis]|uniref:Potassium efflux system protein n=1 Tax=Idiomarina xiamenensis 10-D-4 TaxID=740709 RepID=K2KBD4_9GAMM|nr:monovalent cation:proton antiporter-2 (CPA2) family protein [Idiomarina xiamenensis]EKE83902.1 potassium efflux system protein [Idiomarina xiamenensis 10-D-4]